MKHEVTELDGLKRKLTIELDAADLKRIKSETVKNLSKGVKVQGFRKGKAPAGVTESALDQNQLHNELINDAVNFHYTKALLAEGLDVLAQPQIAIETYEPNEKLQFTAEFEVAPDVTIVDPAKLKIEREIQDVTDDQIAKVLDNIQTSLAEKTTVERAAEDGDEVWIDFHGTDADGNDIPGAKGDMYPLSLGSNTFIPGFEDELVGKSAGDEFDFDTSFPDDYHADKLAGQKVNFKIKVNEVKETVKPELNDEIASKVSEHTSLDALKAEIETNLQHQADEQAQEAYRMALLDAIVVHKDSDIPVPEIMVNEQVSQMLADLRRNLGTRGLTIEQYCQEHEVADEAELIETELKPTAVKRVKFGLILSQVVKDNDVSLDDDELDQAIESITQQQQNAQALLQHLGTEQGRNELRSKLMTEKGMAKLVELADSK